MSSAKEAAGSAASTSVTIRIASGRYIYGYPAGHSARGRGSSLHLLTSDQDRDRMEEYWLRDELARQLDGITEGHVTSGRLNLGFADVVTEQRVFEVEPHYSWRHGARQVIQYAAQCDLKPALAIFGFIRHRRLRDIHDRLLTIELPGLRAASSIELWCWTGTEWEHVTSAGQFPDIPHGTRFGPCTHCGRPIFRLDDSQLAFDHQHWNSYLHLHCCPQLCAREHESVDGCLHWLAKRALPRRAAGSLS
jgi:hypothetical protein